MSLVKQRLHNHVLDIEMNRPDKKNALTTEMYRDLSEAFVAAKHNDDVKVILLSGQPFCFTAGNDLKDFMEQPPKDDDAPVFRFMKAVTDFPKPLVTAVNGPAVGIGTTICLHSDLVYCGKSARFQLPFVKLGLVPEFASSYLLPFISSHAKAFELLVLGEPFNAEVAREINLVNQVFDDENYLNAAHHRAQEIAKLPQQAVFATKQLLRSHYMARNLQAIDQEAREFAKRLDSEEAQAAFANFFKR